MISSKSIYFWIIGESLHSFEVSVANIDYKFLNLLKNIPMIHRTDNLYKFLKLLDKVIFFHKKKKKKKIIIIFANKSKSIPSIRY